MDNKDKLIQIQNETIEDYKRLVEKYKESEEIMYKIIDNQNEQLANQLKLIKSLAYGLE
jgi:predicted house-cleaning noncanonical NTP pyrophosphatase (MazG superfamily)